MHARLCFCASLSVRVRASNRHAGNEKRLHLIGPTSADTPQSPSSSHACHGPTHTQQCASWYGLRFASMQCLQPQLHQTLRQTPVLPPSPRSHPSSLQTQLVGNLLQAVQSVWPFLGHRTFVDHEHTAAVCKGFFVRSASLDTHPKTPESLLQRGAARARHLAGPIYRSQVAPCLHQRERYCVSVLHEGLPCCPAVW